ncbi:hypothetical protein M3Y95_01276700 [Aphelenchoides besseyi]|nr:hypothetical protein M3Y95_01276700 [Aphelenchoides besseyi]
MAFVDVYLCIAISGSILGVVSNSVLLIAIFKASRNKLQAYSFMFVFTASFDLAYSLIELCIQHIVTIVDGTLLIMPNGIERFVPELKYAVMAIHSFLMLHAVFILPCQYKFRYDILRNSHTTVRNLVFYVGLSSIVAGICALNAMWGVYEQQKRSSMVYVKILEDAQVEGRDLYLYGGDMRDFSTQFFCYGSGMLSSNAALGLCVYYAWKSFHLVQGQGKAIKQYTRSLQRDFTVGLIVQTANSVVFAIAPLSLVVFSMIFKINFVNLPTMLPISFLPAINAVLTLYVIKSYRLFVLAFFNRRFSMVVQFKGSLVPINSLS